jgi:hypothetical protein
MNYSNVMNEEIEKVKEYIITLELILIKYSGSRWYNQTKTNLDAQKALLLQLESVHSDK